MKRSDSDNTERPALKKSGRFLRVLFIAVVFLFFAPPLRWAGGLSQAQTACPVPQGPNWTVAFVDSEELVGEGGQPKANAIDHNTATMWHTQWLTASPPPPHEIQIDLQVAQLVSMVGYLPRQDGCSNGWIGQYEIYATTSLTTLDAPVATGTFSYSVPLGCPGAGVPGEMKVSFAPKTARYIRLRALTEVSGNPWTSAAEITVYGPLPLQITTTILPTGHRGFPYSAQLELAGGTRQNPGGPLLAGPARQLSGGQVSSSAATDAVAAPALPAMMPPRRLPQRLPLPNDPPTVFDISPRSGPVGTVITIHGTNFHPSRSFMVSFGLETGAGKRIGTRYPAYVDSKRETAIVPDLPLGPHDVYIDFPGKDWHMKLTRAFLVTRPGE